MGVLVMLIGITFVTVGCDQANKAGGNGDNNPGNVTNSNNQNNSNNNQNNSNNNQNNNNSNNEIAGVWKVLKLGSTTFPTPMTAAPGVPAEAKQQLYLCLTTDKKVIQVVEITGFPQANGFYKNKTEGAYKLLSGNKVEIDLGDGADTVSYTISGINLKLIEVQVEAVKVTSPTEAEIKALP